MIARPDPSAYDPSFGPYVGLVPGNDLLAAYESEGAATRKVLASITEPRSLQRYAPDKWSLRELLLHVADDERIASYRALRFARADATPLESFKSHEYVAPSAAHARSWASLVAELSAVREATLALLRGLPDDAWDRGGMTGGGMVTVRGLAYFILGHEIHHRNVVCERYLGGN